MVRRLIYVLIFAILMVGLVSCSEGSSDANGTKNNSIMPMKVGNEWVYAYSKFNADGGRRYKIYHSILLSYIENHRRCVGIL